jgi:cytochrome P450
MRLADDSRLDAAATASWWQPRDPKPMASIAALLRALVTGDHNLLALLPASAYTTDIGPLGFSRRQIMLVNRPALIREVLVDRADEFPKSDLMVDALDPLVGQSMFTSSGQQWQQQRRMIDPAFSHMRVNRAFDAMQAAVLNQVQALNQAPGEYNLDLMMSQLTADMICRTVFSAPLSDQIARDVFDAFGVFERSVAQVRLRQLITAPAFTHVPQAPEVLKACAQIRQHLGRLVDEHQARGGSDDDIAAALIQAVDQPTGMRFTRAELIDQLGVMFLAGHETTASALTWAFVLLAQNPALVHELRKEIDSVIGPGSVQLEHIRALEGVRQVFRETLRLYPPLTFMPRVAQQATHLGGMALKRGTLLMISPWVLHRHQGYWQAPLRFDPLRFSKAREADLTPGAYIPFGLGPRVCIGAAFAMTEASLILAELVRHFDWTLKAPWQVRAAARLTTRPAQAVWVDVRGR